MNIFINEAWAEETLTIQDAESAPVPPSDFESTWHSILPMVLIFFVIYFIIIRPQEKKRAQQQRMIQELKVGQEIITHAGIYAIIRQISDQSDILEVEIAPSVNMKINRAAISELVNKDVTPETKSTNKSAAKKNIKKNSKAK